MKEKEKEKGKEDGNREAEILIYMNLPKLDLSLTWDVFQGNRMPKLGAQTCFVVKG